MLIFRSDRLCEAYINTQEGRRYAILGSTDRRLGVKQRREKEMKKNQIMNGKQETENVKKNSGNNRRKGKAMEKKKIRNSDRRRIMLNAHLICDHGKAMQWKQALRYSWKAFKNNMDILTYLDSIHVSITLSLWDQFEIACQSVIIENAIHYSRNCTLSKFCYYRLQKMVARSQSGKDENGYQIEKDLSVTAQRMFHHWGFYGIPETTYEDYMQSTADHVARLLCKDHWIENMNAKRKEAGKEPISKITDLIWYATEYAWRDTVKSVVHRMRKSSKTAQFEYFNVESLTDDSYSKIDPAFNKSPFTGIDVVIAVLTLQSVCRDNVDRKIVRMKNNEYTQKQIAQCCRMSQPAVHKRIVRMQEEYHSC